MDFYLATPQGDVHLFSTEEGRLVALQPEEAPPVGADPAQPEPGR